MDGQTVVQSQMAWLSHCGNWMALWRWLHWWRVCNLRIFAFTGAWPSRFTVMHEDMHSRRESIAVRTAQVVITCKYIISQQVVIIGKYIISPQMKFAVCVRDASWMLSTRIYVRLGQSLIKGVTGLIGFAARRCWHPLITWCVAPWDHKTCCWLCAARGWK